MACSIQTPRRTNGFCRATSDAGPARSPSICAWPRPLASVRRAKARAVPVAARVVAARVVADQAVVVAGVAAAVAVPMAAVAASKTFLDLLRPAGATT